MPLVLKTLKSFLRAKPRNRYYRIHYLHMPLTPPTPKRRRPKNPPPPPAMPMCNVFEFVPPSKAQTIGRAELRAVLRA